MYTLMHTLVHGDFELIKLPYLASSSHTADI